MLQYAPEEKGSHFGGQLRLYYFQMLSIKGKITERWLVEREGIFS